MDLYAKKKLTLLPLLHYLLHKEEKRMNARKAACSVIVVLALLFTVVPVFGQSAYYEGLMDGERDGANDAGMIGVLWGALLGIFNVGYVILTPPPDMPASRIVLLDGKSVDYKNGYIEGYKKGRQERRLLYSGLGLGIELLLYYIVLSR